jgi:hypothetical protein
VGQEDRSTEPCGNGPKCVVSKDQRIQLGNHFIVVNPYYAFTYERKKVEFSARLHYLWNSANNDPFVGFGIKSTQPGQAFHVNYATCSTT